MGSRTRFWIMRIRRDRDMVLFGMGCGLILAVLCGAGGGFRIFMGGSAMVFSPKYHGNILVGDVALALEGITRKTRKDPDLDIAMNVDQVHLLRGCVALWTCIHYHAPLDCIYDQYSWMSVLKRQDMV